MGRPADRRPVMDENERIPRERPQIAVQADLYPQGRQGKGRAAPTDDEREKSGGGVEPTLGNRENDEAEAASTAKDTAQTRPRYKVHKAKKVERFAVGEAEELEGESWLSTVNLAAMLHGRTALLRSLLSSYRANLPSRHAARTFASTRASRNVVRELEQRGMLSELTRCLGIPFAPRNML